MAIVSSGNTVSSSAQIVDGIIATADLADNAVTDAKIAAHTTTKITVPTTSLSGTVGTAQIANTAVTLGKLATGTQGDILYYGASGVPTLLAAGTNGTFLKTQGAGANPVWSAAGLTWYASTITVSSNDTATNTAATSFTKLREFSISGSGTINVYYEHRETAAGGTASHNIYKNGVAAGTQQNSPGSTFTAYNENIVVANGDLIQIYSKHSTGGASAEVQNVRIRATLLQNTL